MVAFRGLCRSLSLLAKKGAAKKYIKIEKLCSTTTNTIKPFRPLAHIKSQAVSDGELNMSVRGCGGSNSSLPGVQGGDAQANSVVSWAVCFEKLLEDPLGVRYFTAFLRSEVSAENILFWQACEKFQKIPSSCPGQLKEESLSIYATYLSNCAPYSVNIDDTARTEEKDLEHPTPDMFNKAQAQIFKLMKMDSYRRFVRSPLYQSCTLASVEGRPLPRTPSVTASTGSLDNTASHSPSLSDSVKQKKKSDADPGSPGGKSRTPRDKLREKRGSWGVDVSYPHISVSRKESQMSVKSTSSVELGSIYRPTENGRCSPRPPEQVDGGVCWVAGGYCCVYLPDGSASLAPTRPGLTLRDMLAGLCEKRGFPLKDVVIYLHGKDRPPLSLDQDCSVVRDQQVSLELRVTFMLEVLFTGKPTGIKVKSSKTLLDAISHVLQKHHLKAQDAVVTMSGSDTPLSMSTNVFRLANKKLHLDRVKGKDQGSRSGVSSHTSVLQRTQGQATSPAGPEGRSPSQADGSKAQAKPSKNLDMEELIELVSKAQCRVDDQRGLLTKEHLELPLFLQLPSPPGEEADQEDGGDSTSTTHTTGEADKHTTASSTPAGEAQPDARGTDSPGSKPEDSKETTL